MRIAAALAALALVASVRVASAPPSTLPLVSVPQGVSAWTLAGERMFLVREGTKTVAARPARVDGHDLVWCPREQIFVTPARGDLFNQAGEWVDGPARADLGSYPVRIGDDGILRVTDELRRARGRSRGSVSGEAGEAYRNWRADPSRPIGFCKDPVR